MCKGRDSGNTWRLSVEMEKDLKFLKEEVWGGERRSGERLEGKEERGGEERRTALTSIGAGRCECEGHNPSRNERCWDGIRSRNEDLVGSVRFKC